MTFTKIYSGKVRDLYDAPDGSLVMVASDRMRAFDVVMDEPVPDKGRILTAMSAFWFDHLRSIAPEPPHRTLLRRGTGQSGRDG